MLWGMPKRHTIFCQTNVSMRPTVMVAKASASAYLVRAWDLAYTISVKSYQQMIGMLEVCRHGGVLGGEVLVDLVNDELGVTEYLDLFSAHLFGKPKAS
ncbi:unnamed protein product [Prunus armeniaca]